MTPERKKELRAMAVEDDDGVLLECLDEIERLQGALRELEFPAVEKFRVAREQMERDCGVVHEYIVTRDDEFAGYTVDDVVYAIRRAFEEQMK